MPLVPAKCPECGGLVEVNNEKRAAICQHCGQPFVVEDAIQIFNTYYQTTNNYNTTHNYGNGAIINLYDCDDKDTKGFVIESGVLKKYYGNSVDVVIPNSVYKIEKEAFWDSNIESCIITNNVTIIGDDAFGLCNNLKNVTISNSVKEIGRYCFGSCSHLENMNYNGTLLQWCKIKFHSYSCIDSSKLLIDGKQIPEKLIIPKEITEINDYTFAGWKNIISVTIPEGVRSIGEGAFQYCNKLTNIVIPKTLKMIDKNAFERCAITKISLNEDLYYIGTDAFKGCRNLKKVTVEGEISPEQLVQFSKFGANLVFKKKKMQILYWKETGKCQYCGGDFKYGSSLFRGSYIECSQCGRKKDY